MPRFAFLFTIACLAVAGWATRASAEADRPLRIGLVGAVRSFEDRLDLAAESAGGLRVGIGLDDHASVWIDAVHTTPTRNATDRLAHITGLRGLIQYWFLDGRLMPYVLGGVGGILLDFDDTYDTAAGTITGGAGLEWRASARLSIFGEASLDYYRSRSVTYDSEGQELTSSDRRTDQARTFSLGVLASF